jgi:small subunit ribosomal protein S1
MRGRVLRLMDKGVVVDLGHDIEGFVPMSQLGIADIQNPGDAVKEGQAVELKVLEVDPIHHRIVLAATGWPKDDILAPPPRDTTTPPSAGESGEPEDPGESEALAPSPEG